MTEDTNTPATKEQEAAGNEKNHLAFAFRALGISTAATGRQAIRSVTIIISLAILCWTLVTVFSSG